MSEITNFFSQMEYNNKIVLNEDLKVYLRYIDSKFDKNLYLSLYKGFIYDRIMDIEYDAIPNCFFQLRNDGFDNILEISKHQFVSQYEYDTHLDTIKKCIPFAEDVGGNSFWYSLLPECQGKIIYRHHEYEFDPSFKEGTWIIADSLTQFLSQLIQRNKANPEICKLQEIYNELKEKGFK